MSEVIKGVKDKKAAALKYNPEDGDAPIVTAIGLGHVAEKIVEKAMENSIPIVEDAAMTELLTQLSVGDAIPQKLYEAVAQILVYISKKDGEYKGKLKF